MQDVKPPLALQRHLAGIRRRCALLLVLACLAPGCASTKYAEFRKVPRNPLAAKLHLMERGGPRPSERTMLLLRRYDLVDMLEANPCKLLAALQPWVEREPTAEHFYAVAELAYLGGKKLEASEPKVALDLYGASVMHAYLYLFDPRLDANRNPYDPQFRGASELYNTALESALRIVNKQGKLQPGTTQTISTASREIEVAIVLRCQGWDGEDFQRFEFVSDYEVSGLRNHYRGHGLGVPLIGVRKSRAPGARQGAERYYPPNLSIPVTAVLRTEEHDFRCEPGERPRLKAVLELYDPLRMPDIQVAGRYVPLESDTTTPLGYFLSQPEFSEDELSTTGLLTPEEAQELTGIYMLEPFEPDKIPVIMVHGLWSSPVTWMEMYNDLRNDPAIRRDYQFWFYLYPTGQPFWFSATQMREDMRQMRARLDPQRRLSALDQIVLVGHSMGGLVSKLQTVYSGNAVWETISDRPFEELRAPPDVKSEIRRTVFFEPNPSIRRVITIGTPHRGSDYANDVTRWVSHRLIQVPVRFFDARRRLLDENPGYFKDSSLLSITTSIDSLAPDSPFLPVLLEAPAGPRVKYHTIIGKVPGDSILRRIAGTSDGIVHVDSAKLDSAVSELTVEADHSGVHRHPRSILEVRRILLEHAESVRRSPFQRRVRPEAVPVSGHHSVSPPGRGG